MRLPAFLTCKPEVALLVLMPLVMAAANTAWLYTTVGFLDPWYNVAYFIRYDDPLFLNNYYKIARLSWILPGFLLYQLFNPVVANFVLHVGVLVMSTVFLFLAVARLFDRHIAFAVAAALTVYTPFHGSGGWDYQTAPSGAYYLMAFYLLTTAVLDDRRWLRMLAAGMAYTCAGHADPRMINLAPALALHFVVLSHVANETRPRIISLIRSGLIFVLGGVLVTVVLGLVNYSIGRDFWFFRILLDIVLRYTADPQTMAQWWLPWSAFLDLRQYYYLIFPFVVFVVSLIALAATAFRWTGRSVIAASMLVQYVFVFAIWLLWQSLGHVALQPSYFAYPLIPVAFLAFAALAVIWRPADPQSQSSVLYAGFVALVVVTPLSAAFLGRFLEARIGRDVGLAVLVLAVLAAALLVVGRGRRVALICATLAFSMMNFYAAASWGVARYYRPSEACLPSSPAYKGLIEADRFLNAFSPGLRRTFVWWNKDETLHDRQGCPMAMPQFAASMVSFGSQYLAPPWSGMPPPGEIGEAEIVQAGAAGAKIVVPTADPTNVDRLIARFERSGTKLVLEGKALIHAGTFTFNLYVLARAP